MFQANTYDMESYQNTIVEKITVPLSLGTNLVMNFNNKVCVLCIGASQYVVCYEFCKPYPNIIKQYYRIFHLVNFIHFKLSSTPGLIPLQIKALDSSSDCHKRSDFRVSCKNLLSYQVNQFQVLIPSSDWVTIMELHLFKRVYKFCQVVLSTQKKEKRKEAKTPKIFRIH